MAFRDSLFLAVAYVHIAAAQSDYYSPIKNGAQAETAGSSSGGAPSGSSGGNSSASHSYSHDPNTYIGNTSAAVYLFVSLLGIAFIAAVYRLCLGISRYIRTLTCLNNEKQRYFRFPVDWFAVLKKHLLDAPLFRIRHHREVRLFRGSGLGVIPTRFQSLLVTTIIVLNVALSVQGIKWDQIQTSSELKHFRNRTGTMAVANMIPLVIMAGRNNPFIQLLGISYDSFNLLHRWFGRICLAEAITHMVVWAAARHVDLGGWSPVFASIPHSESAYTGLVGVGAFLIMNIQAMAIIRRPFYEFFLHLHIVLATGAIIGLWYHLDDGTTGKTFLIVVIASWIIERVIRLLRLVYRNLGGRGSSRASIEALPGNALRVTFKLSRPWTFKPGQYFFVTVPAIGLWTSHPFSCAWSDESALPATDEKGLVIARQDILAQPETNTISAIIRGREGFTQKLFQKAANSAGGHLDLSAIVEGPYGLTRSLSSYGTVLLIAGGVGITHQMPYLRSLVIGHANGTTAARRICLVWVVQSPDHFTWIQDWLESILAVDRSREVLRVQIFVTRPRSAQALSSISDAVVKRPGRPNIDTLLEMEISARIGAMAVSVCGTGEMSDDVRRAVRKRHDIANLDLVEETFSW